MYKRMIILFVLIVSIVFLFLINNKADSNSYLENHLIMTDQLIKASPGGCGGGDLCVGSGRGSDDGQ